MLKGLIHKRYVEELRVTMVIILSIFYHSCEKPVRIPIVLTQTVIDIAYESVTASGTILDPGEEGIGSYGFCFDDNPGPEISDRRIESGNGNFIGNYSSRIEGLKNGTKYYIRAYMTSGGDVLYGKELSFTLLKIDVPLLESHVVTDITSNSARVRGKILDDGGGEIIERGVMYSMNSMPQSPGIVMLSGTGTGEFNVQLTDLHTNAVHFVRTFARNTDTIAYSEQSFFIPHDGALRWYLTGDFLEEGYPASDYRNWIPAASLDLRSNYLTPYNLEGYVHMPEMENSFLFLSEPDWYTSVFRATVEDSTGILFTYGEGPIVFPSGYYYITINAKDLTYTYKSTDWAIVGSATEGGWTTDTNLDYNPRTLSWQNGAHLFPSAYFKFRANDKWKLNYGRSSENPDSLIQEGLDIPGPTVEADYAVELNLAEPLEYTYNVHRWGIIGDATSGGWDSDLDMIWDSENRVFSITTDMFIGSFLFRADDDWVYTLGGPDMDGLTSPGQNMGIFTAGNYTITLNPWERIGTIFKNE